jgi:hypothetical protein
MKTMQKRLHKRICAEDILDAWQQVITLAFSQLALHELVMAEDGSIEKIFSISVFAVLRCIPSQELL